VRPIIRWTLWQRRWSLVWWVIGIAAFIILEMAFYPTVRDQAAELEKSFSKLSESAIALFSDTGDFFSPVGYLSGQVFYLMLPLLLGILAIGAGSSLIGKEERERTLELLLSRPISRGRLILAKALAGAVIILTIGLVGIVSTAVMAKLVDLAVPFGNILLAGIASIALVLSFGAIAFMVTLLGGTAKTASLGIASLVALAGYLISSLAATVDWLKWPAKAFPFDYYRPAEILRGTYNWTSIMFIVAVILICGLISWLSFRRRDISG